MELKFNNAGLRSSIHALFPDIGSSLISMRFGQDKINCVAASRRSVSVLPYIAGNEIFPLLVIIFESAKVSLRKMNKRQSLSIPLICVFLRGFLQIQPKMK
jgi:hypothetical protein